MKCLPRPYAECRSVFWIPLKLVVRCEVPYFQIQSIFFASSNFWSQSCLNIQLLVAASPLFLEYDHPNSNGNPSVFTVPRVPRLPMGSERSQWAPTGAKGCQRMQGFQGCEELQTWTTGGSVPLRPIYAKAWQIEIMPRVPTQSELRHVFSRRSFRTSKLQNCWSKTYNGSCEIGGRHNGLQFLGILLHKSQNKRKKSLITSSNISSFKCYAVWFNLQLHVYTFQTHPKKCALFCVCFVFTHLFSPPE
jgi:hypothetical protein